MARGAHVGKMVRGQGSERGTALVMHLISAPLSKAVDSGSIYIAHMYSGCIYGAFHLKK